MVIGSKTHTSSQTKRSLDTPSKVSKTEVKISETEYADFRHQADRVKEDGLVPLIVSSGSAQADTKALTKACRRFDGVSDFQQLKIINGLGVQVESRQLKKFLQQLPVGSHVHVDRNLEPSPATIFQEASAPIGSPTETSAQRLKGLDQVWQQGFRGQGQTIAVIDSGIFPHADLKEHVAAWVDFCDEKPRMVDPLGHGTHVAGIIVGDGSKSEGQIKGVAPEAQIAALRIGSVKDAIEALDWVVANREKYHINVVNLSMGDKATKTFKEDPFAQAVQKAIDNGLVVVVAAGNKGEILTPGTLPQAITVGAVDDKGTATPDDDVLAPFSGYGPTQDGIAKPDILAPGVGIFSTMSPGSASDDKRWPHIRKDYMAVSGTSQAAPMVAGLAALMLQANPHMSVDQVREALISTAHHYDSIPDRAQGGGLIQADLAVASALKTKAA